MRSGSARNLRPREKGNGVARYEYFLFNEALLDVVIELHQADNKLALSAGFDLLDRMPHCSHVEIYRRQRRVHVLAREDSRKDETKALLPRL